MAARNARWRDARARRGLRAYYLYLRCGSAPTAAAAKRENGVARWRTHGVALARGVKALTLSHTGSFRFSLPRALRVFAGGAS